MRYDPIFRYKGWDRRVFKKNKGYDGNVNDHHIIPKQFKNHPLLKKVDYDIHSRFNLLIMPTEKGVKNLKLHPDTTYHCSHPRYNNMVKLELDKIYKSECSEYQLWLFTCWLKKILTDL